MTIPRGEPLPGTPAAELAVPAGADARGALPPVGALLWVPLAAMSFLAYRVVRGALRTWVGWRRRRGGPASAEWQVLCGDELDRPMVLPVLMTTGPRWNTHAVIASSRRLEVAERVAVDTRIADRASGCWTLVINRLPHMHTVAHLSSAHPRPADGWLEIPIQPGEYTVVLRYYQCREELVLPPLRVDGEVVRRAQPLPADTNDFYRTLGRRLRPGYAVLHYYVTVLLRLRSWLPEGWVFGELAPVGNPETTFRFDAVWAGERLEYTVSPELLSTHLVLYTIYGLDSFPTDWGRVEQPVFRSAPVRRHGFVLVRIQDRVGADHDVAIDEMFQLKRTSDAPSG